MSGQVELFAETLDHFLVPRKFSACSIARVVLTHTMYKYEVYMVCTVERGIEGL